MPSERKVGNGDAGGADIGLGIGAGAGVPPSGADLVALVAVLVREAEARGQGASGPFRSTSMASNTSVPLRCAASTRSALSRAPGRKRGARASACAGLLDPQGQFREPVGPGPVCGAVGSDLGQKDFVLAAVLFALVGATPDEVYGAQTGAPPYPRLAPNGAKPEGAIGDVEHIRTALSQAAKLYGNRGPPQSCLTSWTRSQADSRRRTGRWSSSDRRSRGPAKWNPDDTDRPYPTVLPALIRSPRSERLTRTWLARYG
jgi:hypothetical protein